jgi:hypothetical protein
MTPVFQLQTQYYHLQSCADAIAHRKAVNAQCLLLHTCPLLTMQIVPLWFKSRSDGRNARRATATVIPALSLFLDYFSGSFELVCFLVCFIIGVIGGIL